MTTTAKIIEGHPSPMTLTVVPCGPSGQFAIRRPNDVRLPPEMEWEDYYIEFSGYFGSYGPNLFAAAPDMLAALKECLGLAEIAETLTGCRADDDYVHGIRDLLKTTIAKAESQPSQR
jgi:hypothetical protein